jgi:hypothetical protein
MEAVRIHDKHVSDSSTQFPNDDPNVFYNRAFIHIPPYPGGNVHIGSIGIAAPEVRKPLMSRSKRRFHCSWPRFAAAGGGIPAHKSVRAGEDKRGTALGSKVV